MARSLALRARRSLGVASAALLVICGLPCLAGDRLLFNGDFEIVTGTGPGGGTRNFLGWTLSGWDGYGPGAFVNEGACWSANDVTEITFPSGTWALNVRSNPPGDVSSTGIAMSDPFIAGQAFSFSALSENTTVAPSANPVSFLVELLDRTGSTVLVSQPTTTSIITVSPPCPGTPVNQAFSLHTLDTSQLAGQYLRARFSQHTNVQGQGLFTLIDDVKRTFNSCLTFDDLDTQISLASISPETVRASLQRKADIAREAFGRSNLEEVGHVMCAFLAHVDGQDGQAIGSNSANTLRACAIGVATTIGAVMECRN